MNRSHGLGAGGWGLLRVMGLLVVAAPAIRAQAANPPLSPRFQKIVDLAQETYTDSARAMIAKILKQTPTTDSSFPEALFTSAMVAKTGEEMRLAYSKVAVDYSRSAWADRALLKLAQLDYGTGNTEGVVNRVTLLFTDYPTSPILPDAALWGARAAFERKQMQLGCSWLTKGIAGAGTDIELKNQLEFTKQQCNVGPGVQYAPPVNDSLRAGPPPVTPPPPPPPPTLPPRDTGKRGQVPVRPPATVTPPKTVDKFRIQVAAITDKGVIAKLMQKIKDAGFVAYKVPGPRGLTKIQAGPFATRDAALAQLPKIKKAVAAAAFITPTP